MNAGSVAIGLSLGLGLASIYSWLVARTARLEDRISPHVRTAGSSTFRAVAPALTPFPTVERLLAPILRDGVRAVERWGSSTTDLNRRLRRAGSPMPVEQYRTEQVLWALAGLALGVTVSIVLASTRGASALVLLVMTLACCLAGAAARDASLGRDVKRREARITAELPTVAELLALSVSAGEGAVGALERVARSTRGVMAEELAAVLGAARAGTSLTQALERLGEDSGVPALRRFVDGIATAVERGTPLAEVLRAQAQDVRADGRRALMEEGGRREIAMLVPVVFLILPVTVIFAVYPGLVAIRLDF